MKVIIIGAGEIGYHIAEKLCHENKDVIIIDANPERISQIEEQLDAQFIVGSGSSPDILQQAGISQAGMVIAVSDQDEVNLVACMVARHFSPSSIKVARVRNPSYLRNPEVFEDLQFDLFINPEYEAAEKFMRLIEVPQALDLVHFANGKVMLAAFRVEPQSLLDNQKLFGLGKLVPNYTPLVAAIYRGHDVIIPRGADTLKAGDIVYFTATPEHMPYLLRLVGKKSRQVERVMIFGGSNTGLALARKLERRGIDVKLIEPNEARCTVLADQLTRTTVLQGEGMDSELLIQENIAQMDVFIATSKDSEDNILTSLLARSLGVRYAMTLHNRLDYTALVASMGIDAAVSPQLAAVSRILQFLRQGRVMAVEAIRETSAEGIEFVAMETSDAVGRPLMKIKFPRGALVMAVVHDEEVIIPSGETVIQPGDRVIMFVELNAIAKVEQLFAVKLEYF